MIGVGVGVGFGGVGLSPSWLTSQLISVYGAILGGLVIGEDVVVSGTDITSWPGRVGGTFSPLVSPRSTARAGGRASTTTSDLTAVRAYASVTAATGAWICVAEIPALPFANVSVLMGTAGFNLYGNAGTSTIASGTGSVLYVDGATTNSVAGLTGTLHVLEAQLVCLSGAIHIGGYAEQPTWNWPGPLSLGMWLTEAQSAGQRAAAVALLKRYYRI